MKKLLAYYKDCLGMIDTFHFNSNGTRDEYERILGHLNGEVVTITHNGIKDNRTIKTFSEKGLVIGFIGGEALYKGLPLLKEAAQGLDVQIMVWGAGVKEQGNVHFRGSFSSYMLKDVYGEIDVLIVPSIWHETFSLVTMEALSFGTPAIVSDSVGARDLVCEYMLEMVYHSKEELRTILEECVKDKTILKEYNKRICEQPWRHDTLRHAQEVIDIIYK